MKLLIYFNDIFYFFTLTFIVAVFLPALTVITQEPFFLAVIVICPVAESYFAEATFLSLDFTVTFSFVEA